MINQQQISRLKQLRASDVWPSLPRAMGDAGRPCRDAFLTQRQLIISFEKFASIQFLCDRTTGSARWKTVSIMEDSIFSTTPTSKKKVDTVQTCSCDSRSPASRLNCRYDKKPLKKDQKHWFTEFYNTWRNTKEKEQSLLSKLII